jgi:hypothetical protein
MIYSIHKSLNNLPTIIISLYAVFIFYMPTIRLGNIPIRLEDFLLLLIGALFFIKKKSFFTRYKVPLYPSLFLLLFFWILYFSLISSNFIDSLNFKTVIISFNYLKYVLLFFTVYFLARKVNIKFITKVLVFIFITQLLILIFQKFDMFGFGSGFFYNFIVNNYSVPNVYSTSANDLEQLKSTHMNFSFRPVGTIGSATRVGMIMYILSFILYLNVKKPIFRLLGWVSLLMAFSKIAILFALIFEFIIMPFLHGKRIIFLKSILILLFILPIGFYLIEVLGLLNNLNSTLSGDNRGITHRIIVFSHLINQDIFNMFFGNYGKLPFDYFDSGIMLNIYRYGLIFYILQYILFYLLLVNATSNKINRIFILSAMLFADFTFGSILYPQFANLIILSVALIIAFDKEYSNTKEKNKDDKKK